MEAMLAEHATPGLSEEMGQTVLDRREGARIHGIKTVVTGAQISLP